MNRDLDIANEKQDARSENWVDRLSSDLKYCHVSYLRLESPSQLETFYDIREIIGEGSFGKVFLGIRKADEQKCAIKKITRDKACSFSQRNRLDREIHILRMVKHPGIIELYAVAETPTFLFLITQFCSGNSLLECLQTLPPDTGFPENIVAEITRQTASAVSYLHNRGIIHRDLKAENIMLLDKFDMVSTKSTHIVAKIDLKKTVKGKKVVYTDKDALQGAVRSKYMVGVRNEPHTRSSKISTGPKVNSKLPNGTSSTLVDSSISEDARSLLHIKLIDFGLAVEVRNTEDQVDQQCGTPMYMAPEILFGKLYTRQCDVWSIGVLIFLLLTGTMPIQAKTEAELIEAHGRFSSDSLTADLDYLSVTAKNCLTRVLNVDPAYRYSANELALDPWLTDTPLEHGELMTSVVPSTSAARQRKASSAALMATKQSNGSDKSSTATPVGESIRCSISTIQSSRGQSTTNVLQLMKQYHREMLDKSQHSNQSRVSGPPS